MKNTATSAGNENKTAITFNGKEHEEFFYYYLQKCRRHDAYHAALVYCLGISRDTRENITRIYDFKNGLVKPECLSEGWQTSGSRRIVHLAFNLYCNGTPSVYGFEDSEEQLDECKEYAVDEIFCCGYAPLFWQAIKIRYPEYCM